ncbi:MAG: hypothetical protein HYY18_09135 [Planctomycetes bacterium]|nr:hypothetical protein [Planctomycetota bacterium]
MNSNLVDGDDEFVALVLAGASKYREIGRADFPVIIDADPGVPWKEVVGVIDLCKRNRISRIELAAPYPEKQK